MQEGLKELEVLLDPYDWFYEVDAEPLRYVVYVTAMNSEQNSVIPDRVQGKQVVIHFARSKMANAQEFMAEDPRSKPLVNWKDSLDAIAATGKLPLPLSGPYSAILPDGSGSVTQEDLDTALEDLQSVQVPNLDELGRELDRLERQCGPNILFDIFFEIHDGKNAVTNLGTKFPDVHRVMQGLYHEYGFDPIYNELEG